MANPVVHFEIMGKDGAKMREYYSKLFGWKIDASNPMQYGLVAPEEKGIGGGIGGTDEGRPGYVTLYVGVDDVDATLARAESLGGKTIMPKTVVPGMVTFALFSDPEGNMIGLVDNKMPV